MKYIRQFLIILAFSFIGELLKYLLPFPVPASIYGMVLLFIALLLGIVKLEWIHETGHFLIDIMPIMFIPAGVGLMASWGVLQPIIVPVVIITLACNITVMAASGHVSQWMIRRSRKGEEAKSE